MSSPPYIAMYPSDFLADVGHLGNTELGIYWRLLLVYYRDAKPLPFDTDRLRRLAMTFSPEECRALDGVVAEFFILSAEADGSRVWRHTRADREIASASDKHAKASAKASAAAAVRWSKDATGSASSNAPSMPQAIPQAMLEQCQPEPEPEPLLKHTQTTSVVETQDVSPPCPHAEILALFAKHLPAARQPAEWSPARQAVLRARWREKRNRQNLEWWDRFFGFVAESRFLTGQTSSKDRQPFLLSLDWLLKPANFLKVIEGAYHTETA